MNIQTVTFEGLSFVNVVDPKEIEIKSLIHDFEFESHDIEDYINAQQTVKIESRKNYILIAIDFPYVDPPEETAEKKENKNSNGNGETKTSTLKEKFSVPVPLPLPDFSFMQEKKKRIRTAHVNFYIGEDFVVVLHDEKTPLIDFIFSECQKTLKKRKELMGFGPSYLFYRIADLLIDSTFGVMSEIVSTIEKIDIDSLEEHPPTDIVEDISLTRRNIVVFNSMIKPSLNVFSDIRQEKYPGFKESSITPWSSIYNHLEKIRYRLEGSRELIEGLSISHESLLTARTNQIIKVLTMFTAVMLPLTLITGIYGMNILDLPYANKHFALDLIAISMGILSMVMIIGFKIKKWL